MDLLSAAAYASHFVGLAVSHGTVATAGISVVAAVRRQWLTSRRFARLTAIAPPMTVVLLLLGGFRFAGEADVASKATVLAMTISETMNCMALTLICLFAVVPAWVISARQIRRERASSPPESSSPRRGPDE